MCVRSVNVDEARLRRINSSFSDMEVIDRWLEGVIADAISYMEFLSKNDVLADEETMSIEEARAMVHAAIHEEYAKV